MFKTLKTRFQAAFHGITSEDFQTIKRAKYEEMSSLLSKYSSPEGAQMLISAKLSEYKSRSALEYATSLLLKEVKEMLRTDREHKAIDIPTVPNSEHKVSEVMSTFVMIYDHCRTHNKDLVETTFSELCKNILQYNMGHHWKGDEDPGLETIEQFIHDLISSYEIKDDSTHFTLHKHNISHTDDDHYQISIGDGAAMFDIQHDGSVIIS